MILTSLCVCGVAHGEVIARWDFNSEVADANTSTGTTSPVVGAGSATTVGGTTVSFASADTDGGSTDPAAGDDSGWTIQDFPAASAGDRTAGAQFAVSTVGFTNIVVVFDQRHSNQAARTVRFQYSVDGVSFIDADQFVASAGNSWFNTRSSDLTGIAGIANNAAFAFRIVSEFADGESEYLASNPGSSYATGGTYRFDQVTVSGEAIPAPSSLSILVLAATAQLLRPNRRAKACRSIGRP